MNDLGRFLAFMQAEEEGDERSLWTSRLSRAFLDGALAALEPLELAEDGDVQAFLAELPPQVGELLAQRICWRFSLSSCATPSSRR